MPARTPLHACTIVANNYLAYARVLTRSFLEHNPDGRMHVLVVDRPQAGHDYAGEPFAVTFVEELGIPGFLHLAFRYSLLELNTAVKPFFLQHLQRTTGASEILYFDPDILIAGPLDELYERLATRDVLLTPHLTAPLEDGKVPAEQDILLAGIYNLGFLGLAFNPRTAPFLDWWGRRLLTHGRSAVHEGLFVDQRWMDFAPSFLPQAEILRDLGCNVAYWNLAHRRLRPSPAGGWTVEGSEETPLRFFHFSGLDSERPDLISKFQDRFTFADRPDVEPLFRLYHQKLREEGHAALRAYPYAYARFRGGAPVPALARNALRLLDPRGERWPNPFDDAGSASFAAYLAASPDRAGHALPLPRLALLTWDQRSDLQTRFPDPSERHREPFARWFLAFGERGGPPDPFFTRDLERAVDALAMPEGAGLPAGGDLPLASAAHGWLLAEAGYEPGLRPLVPRLALEIHRQRNDLSAALSEPLGADRRRLALWYVTYGWQEYRLPQALVRPVLRTLSPRDRAWAALWRWKRRRQEGRTEGRPQSRRVGDLQATDERSGAAAPPQAEPLFGVDVVGFLDSATGVGQACRNTLEALSAGEIPHAVWSLKGEADDARDGSWRAPRDRSLLHAVTLFHVNADGMLPARREVPLATTLARKRVAVWFWEVAHLPLAFAEAFDGLDEIWAPSTFCARAYEALAPIPVLWVPPCVPPPASRPASRAELGVPEGAFLFYFAFDTLSVPERKNPEGLLEAFAEVAARAPRPVHLLLKVQRPEAAPVFMARLRERAHGLPVTFFERTVSRGEQDSLLAGCDAYVSLHRSEGLGLPLIEAMYLGKPVVATAYGGVTDFLDPQTAAVVPHRLVPLAQQIGPYPAGAVWAEPDPEAAAERMLALLAEPEIAARRAEAAQRRVHELYAPPIAALRLRRELERLLGR